jgi:unspecific monooxygenase
MSPFAQARLSDELATLELSIQDAGDTWSKTSRPGDVAADGPRLPPPSSLDKLPYLSAILNESFRMRPTSTPLPRVTPRDRSVSLAGVDNIPPGTRVNVFQWFIHRNEENYDQVHEWHPERWLETEGEGGKSPLLWAFGGGSRTCVGTSLTQYRRL